MVNGFYHIGLCVKSIDNTFKWMQATMAAKMLYCTEYPDRHQRSAMVVLPDGISKFELMEPMGETGVVADFIEKQGEGIHHVSLKVNNLECACSSFEAEGNRIISKGNGVAFVHPKGAGGVLYELSDGTFKRPE